MPETQPGTTGMTESRNATTATIPTNVTVLPSRGRAAVTATVIERMARRVGGDPSPMLTCWEHRCTLRPLSVGIEDPLLVHLVTMQRKGREAVRLHLVHERASAAEDGVLRLHVAEGGVVADLVVRAEDRVDRGEGGEEQLVLARRVAVEVGGAPRNRTRQPANHEGQSLSG